MANSVGLGLATPAVQILLPIAISYMTFEEIAYAMDIYRRQIEPTRSVVDYGLFVAFFPKLVAGPILRPLELLPQISGHRSRPDRAQLREGLGLILLGLFKKVVSPARSMTEVLYLVSERYMPAEEGGFRHDDPELGVTWPRASTVVSDKDRGWPDLGVQRAAIEARMG